MKTPGSFDEFLEALDAKYRSGDQQTEEYAVRLAANVQQKKSLLGYRDKVDRRELLAQQADGLARLQALCRSCGVSFQESADVEHENYLYNGEHLRIETLVRTLTFTASGEQQAALLRESCRQSQKSGLQTLRQLAGEWYGRMASSAAAAELADDVSRALLSEILEKKRSHPALLSLDWNLHVEDTRVLVSGSGNAAFENYFNRRGIEPLRGVQQYCAAAAVVTEKLCGTLAAEPCVLAARVSAGKEADGRDAWASLRIYYAVDDANRRKPLRSWT